MNRITPSVLALAALVIACVNAPAADNMKAFPPAEEGMTRFVLPMPPEKDEDSLKIELMIGKTVLTDAGNRYFFGGTLATETVQGWGFDYHILRKLGPMAGTLMAVDPAAPKVERFITIGGEPQLLRYNSRLPLVVYVPVGVESPLPPLARGRAGQEGGQGLVFAGQQARQPCQLRGRTANVAPFL
ncbi:MAG: ecotin family protein [Chthoniobacter sp.]|nr:ecotin family protein [Chthoniobacter sp.]